MARSTYIYLVTDGNMPKAAFTVKHELVSWLDRRDPTEIQWYKFWRIGDGIHGSEPTVMTSADVEKGRLK